MENLYPECEKLAAVQEQSQAIGGFLEHMRGEGMELCKRDDDDEMSCPHCGDDFGYATYTPTYDTIEKMLADYFGINLNKVEEERRAMLEALRANQ